MTKTKILLGAVLVATAGVTFAADNVTSTTRDERMDQALQSYRSKNPSGSSTMSSGTMSSGTNSNSMRSDRPSMDKSFGQNMKAAGSNMAEAGREIGHGVAQGARKTGHAVHKGASKVSNKAKDMTTDKPAP